MGVKGLWDLISPSGRQVRLDTLEGRVVAVDASIWLVQFIKALRNSEGNVFRGAHLIGFFKRFCKLQYYRIRPIIVFDGPPPALKRRTLGERRARREEELKTFRKTAQKLVVNFVRRKAVEAKRRKRGDIDAPTTQNAPTLRDVLEGRTSPPIESDSAARTIHSIEDSDSDALIDIEGDLLPKRDPSDDVDEETRIHDEAVARQAERRRQRHAYYESIPEDFRGFLAERRRLDEIHVPNQTSDILGNSSRLTTKERLAAFGITIHDVDDEVKFKRPLLGQSPTNEFKEFATRNEFGEETFIQLPLNAEIDETVFRALPTRMQYKILCQIRDQWLSDLRLHAIAAKDNADVFSNVQIESYIRTIRSNQEIEKVKKKMGEEVKLKHFGTLNDRHDDPLGVSELNQNEDDGGFLDFYQTAETNPSPGGENLALEEKIKKSLEQQQSRNKQKESKAAETAMRHAVQELDDPGTGKRTRGKHLSLFRKWETEEDTKEHDVHLARNTLKVEWGTKKQAKVKNRTYEDDSDHDDDPDDVPEMDHKAMLDDLLKDIKVEDKVETPRMHHSSSSSSPPLSMTRKIKMVKKSASKQASSKEPSSGGDDDGWGDWDEEEERPAKKFKDQEELNRRLAQHLSKVFQEKSALSSKPAPLITTKAKPTSEIPSLVPRNKTDEGKPPLQHPSPQPPKVSSHPPAATPLQPPAATPSAPSRPPAAPSPAPSQPPAAPSPAPSQPPAVTPSQPPAATPSAPSRPPAAPSPAPSQQPAATPSQPPVASTPAVQSSVKESNKISSSSQSVNSDGWDSFLVQEVSSRAPMPDAVSTYEVESPAARKAEVQRPPVQVESIINEADFRIDDFIPVQPQVEEVISSGPSMSSAAVPGPSMSPDPSSSSSLETDLDEGLNWLRMSEVDFERNLMKRSQIPDPLSGMIGGDVDLDELAETLEEEAETLLRNLKKSKARSDDVTEEMHEEIRQLCRAFGIPYVQAPSEAEAQASWLVQNKLAEAVMSDDSDSMVFGATEVFRGFFSDNRGIELYSQRELERCLGLTVKDLRLLALLLGCDYTLGVKGIGIVNALEVVAAYPQLNDLEDFVKWARDLAHSTDPGISSSDTPLVKDYKIRHAGYRATWEFPQIFPPREAHEAFVNPRVDQSREPFTWAMPDVDEILTLMRSKAGLQSHQILETLTPVLKRMREMPEGVVRRQALVDTFLQRPAEDAVAVYRSERLRRTIDLLTKKQAPNPSSRKTTNRKRKQRN